MRVHSIREQCQHRWDSIFNHFDVPPEVLSKRHQACVFCGGKDRANYADKGYGIYYCNQCASGGIDGFEFLQRFTMRSFKSIADEIEDILGTTVARPAQQTDVGKAREKLNTIWRGSEKISWDDPVGLYLTERGLVGLDLNNIASLRYHQGLDYWERDENNKFTVTGNWPVMVGLVRNSQSYPASLHVTYLDLEGNKAPVDNPRKQMTPIIDWKGGAIRLEKLKKDQDLCICEGIETALALKILHPEFCVWSCLNSGGLEDFMIPGDVNVIHIAGDNDYSFTGHAAVFAFAKRMRLEKKSLGKILIPETTGDDFNDVLLKGKKNGRNK